MKSNGLALTPDTTKVWWMQGIGSISVSLDGLEETHDHLRASPGLFRRVTSAIQNLIEAELPITVLTTVNALNISELPAMYDHLLLLGVRSWQIQPIFPLGRVRKAPHLQLNHSTYMHFGEFVSQRSKRATTDGLEILPGENFGYFTDFDLHSPPWRGCPAGLFSCGITSNGKVKGCLSMPDNLTEGDLREKDLWDIWFAPDSFRYNRIYSTETLGDNCRDCDKAELCQGGCSSMSYGATGAFHNDPYCFYRIARTH